MKLETKHLAPYLPYGLIVQWIREDDKAIIMSDLNISDYNFLIKYKRAKPILRPLSDLAKEIEVNGEKFVPIEILNNNFMPLGKNFGFAIEIDKLGKLGYRTPESWLNPMCHYDIFQKLLEWHFDIYGLIENGLAVDINTLES